MLIILNNNFIYTTKNCIQDNWSLKINLYFNVLCRVDDPKNSDKGSLIVQSGKGTKRRTIPLNVIGEEEDWLPHSSPVSAPLNILVTKGNLSLALKLWERSDYI